MTSSRREINNKGDTMNILISACLLGLSCRYDGKSKGLDMAVIEKLKEKHTLIPACPEQLGGLPTPRNPSERIGEKVMMDCGADVTEQYSRGAQQALKLAKTFGCEAAILKELSPSCGSGSIYDGTFSGTLTPGDGVTAELFKAEGIAVYGESGIEKLL